MPTQLRWAAESDLDRVAETRMLCFGQTQNAIEQFKLGLKNDVRAKLGDYLLAEQDGIAVGTTTAFSLTMYVRGAALPCQGVGYVGTIKTHRRRGGQEKGVASQLMAATIDKARQREQILTALMPFRASFYEHFGYGVVERTSEWTVPLSVLPGGDFSGISILRDGDLPAFKELRQRRVIAGQCDIERSPESWTLRQVPGVMWQFSGTGFEVIDRGSRDGPAQGYAHFVHEIEGGRNSLRVHEWHAENTMAFKRLLSFFGSLKDQYSFVRIGVPANLPLNWLLKERQIPHRPVEHATAEVRPYTRMQVRILDHLRFVEAINWPNQAMGSAVVQVQEPEGHTSRFSVDVTAGKARAKPSQQSANFTCDAPTWAAIACGDLPATIALQNELASGDETAARLLDELSRGPVPFCNEYF